MTPTQRTLKRLRDAGYLAAVVERWNSHAGIRRGSEEWLFYAFRATVRTLRWWYEHGYLTIKGDKP